LENLPYHNLIGKSPGIALPVLSAS
jgi:hypothetical protein